MLRSQRLPTIRYVNERDAVLDTSTEWIDHGTYHISGNAHRLGVIAIGQRAYGQTTVEFVFIIPIFLLLLLGVAQIMVIGGAALAINQAALCCARYASLNPSATQSAVASYLANTASPLINDSGLQPLTLTPTTVPRQTGAAVAVTVSYNLKNKLFCGTTFFGVTFPSQLSVTQTMTSE